MVVDRLTSEEFWTEAQTPHNHPIGSRLKYMSNPSAAYLKKDQPFYLVVRHEGQLIGVLTLEPSPYHAQELWLMGISVDPAHRHQGVASALIRALFELCQGEQWTLQRSSATHDGARFLPSVFAAMQQAYPTVVVLAAQ